MAESHTANSSSESKGSFLVHKAKKRWENIGLFCHIQWQLQSAVMSQLVTESSIEG